MSSRALGGLAMVAAVACAFWWLDGTDPGHGVQAWRVDRQQRAAEFALRDSVRRLGTLVRTQQVWSEVDAALESTGAAVVVIGTDAPAAAQAAESLLTLLPVASDPKVRQRYAIIERPALPARPIGLLSSFVRLPSPGTAEPCVAVRVVFPRDSTSAEWDLAYFRGNPWDGAIGPCWYLARFGQPGPQIRRWLNARYWDVAAMIPPTDLRPFVEEPRAGGWFEAAILGELGRLSTEAALREFCSFGKPDRCEARLLNAPYPEGLMPEGMAGNWRSFRGFSTPSWDGPSLLAVMVQELGPDQFLAFWRSEATVQEAFQQAAGAPIGKWYSSQVRRQLQEAGYPVPRGGPVWFSILGTLALAFLASVWHAKRRQVR